MEQGEFCVVTELVHRAIGQVSETTVVESWSMSSNTQRFAVPIHLILLTFYDS